MPPSKRCTLPHHSSLLRSPRDPLHPTPPHLLRTRQPEPKSRSRGELGEQGRPYCCARRRTETSFFQVVLLGLLLKEEDGRGGGRRRLGGGGEAIVTFGFGRTGVVNRLVCIWHLSQDIFHLLFPSLSCALSKRDFPSSPPLPLNPPVVAPKPLQPLLPPNHTPSLASPSSNQPLPLSPPLLQVNRG